MTQQATQTNVKELYLSGGSFGFYIPSSDEVNLANFSFYADLVPR